MKTVGIHPVPSRVVFYIWSARIRIFGQIRNRYKIRYAKFENGLGVFWPFSTCPLFIRDIPFSKYGISRFWPNRNSNLDSPQSRQERQGALCSGFEYAPGCNYIDHRLPHSHLSKRGGTKLRRTPGGWRLQLAACELAAASLPCWAAIGASELFCQA